METTLFPNTLHTLYSNVSPTFNSLYFIISLNKKIQILRYMTNIKICYIQKYIKLYKSKYYNRKFFEKLNNNNIYDLLLQAIIFVI